jgi:hypothetical protein
MLVRSRLRCSDYPSQLFIIPRLPRIRVQGTTTPAVDWSSTTSNADLACTHLRSASCHTRRDATTPCASYHSARSRPNRSHQPVC